MITKTTATTALILTVFALGGGTFVYTEVTPTPAAYAQVSEIDDMVDNTLDTVDISEEEADEEQKQGNIGKQSIDQVPQMAIGKSDQSDGNSNNVQMSGPADHDIAQGALNSNGFEKSSSGSTYTKEEYSSFTYRSTDDPKKANQQEAGYSEEQTQEDKVVHQEGSLIPTHDTADFSPASVVTSIALPVNALLEDELE